MGTLLSYSLAASVIILVLIPILHQTVNRSTSFRFNRAVILCGIMLSLTLPWIFNADFIAPTSGGAHGNIDFTLTTDTSTSGVLTTEHNHQDAPATAIPWIAIAIFIYISGIVILLCREAISFVRLSRMISHSEKTEKDGITLCRLADAETAPFSWGNYIFLHDFEFSNPTDCIYIHEKAHTDKRHWIDILIADLFCITLWYNPFAWMTRQLMKLNHEFEADSAVISTGIDTHDYQRLLVIKAMGMRSISVTNSFAADRRSFRKRVLIMSKKRSAKKTMLIATCIIPAAFISGLAITSSVSAGILDAISNYKFAFGESSTDNHGLPTLITAAPLSAADMPVKNETDTITVIPSPLKDQTALAEIIKLSMKTVSADKTTKVNIEIIVDENGKIKDVVADNPDGTLLAAAIDRNLNGIRFEQTSNEGKPIETRFNIPIIIKKSENDNTNSGKTQKAGNSEGTTLPEFIGGNTALNAFIIENIKTPGISHKEPQSKNSQTVNVHFTVDTDGSVKDTKVVVSQIKDLDNEAIRVINLTSGKWKPAVQNGTPLSYSLSIPITFSNL